MGYCMGQISNDFRILEANVEKARQAIVELMRDQSRGSGGSATRTWFSWMNEWDEKIHGASLHAAMTEWRWEPEWMEQQGVGDVVGVYFIGEKMGDDEIFLQTIAPFVLDGSYIEMAGEDGERWRWFFTGGNVYRQIGHVVYGPIN